LQFFEEQLPTVIRELPAHRKGHRLGQPPAPQRTLDHFEEIIGLLPRTAHLSAPNDAQRMPLGDVHPREEHVPVSRDQVLQQDEPVFTGIDETRAVRRVP
jgi:hypothetical protein